MPAELTTDDLRDQAAYSVKNMLNRLDDAISSNKSDDAVRWAEALTDAAGALRELHEIES